MVNVWERTMVENFRTAKQVTIGELPTPNDRIRLWHALGNYSAASDDPIYHGELDYSQADYFNTIEHCFDQQMLHGPAFRLCPNAKFLQFSPLQPYAAEMGEHISPAVRDLFEYRPRSDSPAEQSAPLLDSLCHPTQVCFHEVFGSYEDLRAAPYIPVTPFYTRLKSFLHQANWAGAEMSWHGPLAKRYTPKTYDRLAREHDVEFSRYKRVRIFLPTRLDIIAPSPNSLTHRNFAQQWASSMISGILRHFDPRFDRQLWNTMPEFVLNVGEKGAQSIEERLRPRLRPVLRTAKLSSIKKSITTAILCLEVIDQDTDYIPITSDLGQSIINHLIELGDHLRDLDIFPHDINRTIRLVRRAQQLIDEAATVTPSLDQEEIMNVIVALHQRPGQTWMLWNFQHFLGGRSIQSRVNVKIGREQEPCPVCSCANCEFTINH